MLPQQAVGSQIELVGSPFADDAQRPEPFRIPCRAADKPLPSLSVRHRYIAVAQCEAYIVVFRQEMLGRNDIIVAEVSGSASAVVADFAGRPEKIVLAYGYCRVILSFFKRIHFY